jgi:hypothetical protein
MRWQASSVVARIGKALGLRRRWREAASVERALRLRDRAGRGETRGALVRAAERRLAALPEDERFHLTKLLVDLDAEAKSVVQRGLASDAPFDAVVALARAWPTLKPSECELAIGPLAKAVAGPVAIAGAPARQVDETTCGAAAMAMMTAIGDPFVGIWLASGRVFAHYRPPEIERIAGAAWLNGPAERWAEFQKSIHVDTVRHGLLLLVPWPRGLGTPPWRVDNRLRFGGIRFRGAIVDDTDVTDLDALIAHASAAISDGIPVPIYASGDSRRGLDTVIPRHVVLLTHRFDGGFFAYEPASAALHSVTDRQLKDGGKALRALGNWSHVSWMILPQARELPRPPAGGAA